MKPSGMLRAVKLLRTAGRAGAEPAPHGADATAVLAQGIPAHGHSSSSSWGLEPPSELLPHPSTQEIPKQATTAHPGVTDPCPSHSCCGTNVCSAKPWPVEAHGPCAGAQAGQGTTPGQRWALVCWSSHLIPQNLVASKLGQPRSRCRQPAWMGQPQHPAGGVTPGYPSGGASRARGAFQGYCQCNTHSIQAAFSGCFNSWGLTWRR